MQIIAGTDMLVGESQEPYALADGETFETQIKRPPAPSATKHTGKKVDSGPLGRRDYL
ncbi:hypothetical protein D3C80_2010070 [compost metagenome]